MKSYIQALGAFVLGFIAIFTIAAVQSTARFPSIELRDFLTIIGGPSTTNHIGGNATVITNWLALSGTTNRLSDDGTNLLRNGIPIGSFATNISFVSNLFVTNLTVYELATFSTNITIDQNITLKNNSTLIYTNNTFVTTNTFLFVNSTGAVVSAELNGGDGVLVTSGTNISANFLGGTNILLTTNTGVITINSTGTGGAVTNLNAGDGILLVGSDISANFLGGTNMVLTTNSGVITYNTTNAPVFQTSASTPLLTSPSSLRITPAAGSNVTVNFSQPGWFAVNTNTLTVTNNTVGVNSTAPEKTFHVQINDGTSHSDPANWGGMMLKNGNGTPGSGVALHFQSLISGVGQAGIVGRSMAASDNMALDFYTETIGGRANRMTLNNNGNLGIGTNTPGVKLHVIGTNASIALNPNAGGNANTLLMGLWTTADIAIGAWNSLSSPTATVPLIFSASNVLFRSYASGAYTDRMLLSSAGNLGIGTVNPLAKLAINGGVNVGADTDPGDNNLSVAGHISSINGVSLSWPSVQGASDTFLRNNGSGVLTWVAGTGSAGPTNLNAGDGILFTSGTNISANFLGGTNVTLTTNSGVITINSAPGTETTNIHFNLEPTDVFWVNTNWFAITNAHVGIGRVGPVGAVSGEQMTIQGSGNTGFLVASTGTGTPRIYFRSVPGGTPTSEMGTASHHRLDFTMNTTPRMTIAPTTGHVGINDTTPASRFTVGAGDPFQINDTGNIIRINDVLTSFPAAQGAANTFLRNNGSGTLTWEDIASASVTNVISVFNVKNYGAVGDGTTDDRSAITNATQLAASAGGGIVYFPPGAYLVPAQINWPISSNVTWMGAGMGASHIVMDVGGDPALTIGLRIHSGDVNTPIQFVTIKDLTIRSPDATDSATWDLIQTGDYVFDMMVERVEFKWARHSGLRSAPNSPSTKGWRQTVKNCYFHNIQNPPMTDIAGAALLGIHHDALVEGTVFENIGQGSLFHATYLGQTNTVGIRMIANSFRGTNLHTRMGMDGENQKGVVVTGNTFDNGTRNFMSGFNGATIAGNIFRNSGLQIGANDHAIVANQFYMDRNEGGSFINTFIQNGSPSTNVAIMGNSFVNALPDNATNLVIGILPSGGGVRWMIKDNDFSGYIQSAQLTEGGFHHFINNDVTSSRDGRIFQANGATNGIVQLNRFRGLASGASVDIAAASAPSTTAIENELLGTSTWLNPASPKIMYVRTDGTNTALVDNLFATNDVSALTFTDRSDSPNTIEEAYRIVLSHAPKNGRVDHTELDPLAWGRDQSRRNMSMVMSAQSMVIQDLLKRLAKLENNENN